MALDKEQFKTDIFALMKEQATRKENDQGESLAGGLADIIDAYIKSATVTMPALSLQVSPPTAVAPLIPFQQTVEVESVIS